MRGGSTLLLAVPGSLRAWGAEPCDASPGVIPPLESGR
jgi:hypothetical protein